MQGYLWTARKGITGKLAQEGNRGLGAVMETIYGDGTVSPPLIIYKRAKRYMGWYQNMGRHTEAADYLFGMPAKGWTNRKLGIG